MVSESTKKSQSGELVCKPSELPLYSPTTEKPKATKQVETKPEPGIIENTFATLRRTIFSFTSEVEAYQRVATDYIETGIENADGLIKYLGEEDATAPKAGAIALGGLTGIIFGLRGGLFKKTLYGTVGAGIMASICYPKEAKEYSEIAYEEGKKYATIAYNFAYGGEWKCFTFGLIFLITIAFQLPV